MKKIERDGETYDVIDETETEFCVEVDFPFYYKVKTVELWWDKKYCNVILEDGND